MPNPPKTGFRFSFGGVNLTSTPDSIPPDKFASALNIRAYSPTAVRTRPGYAKLFGTANNNAITDVMSYSALGTDSLPRYLAHDSAGRIWLDGANNNGVNVGNMAAPQGYGAAMLPWRPSQSPQTWMYVATQGDYQKFSAPDSNNNVTQYKVGIAEPQIQVEAATQTELGNVFTNLAINWGNSGTAGVTSDATLTSDTAVAVFSDPANATKFSVQVASTQPYITGQLITFTALFTNVPVEDVFPPIATGSSGLTIQAIRYASGSTGRCVIVCAGLPIGTAPEPGAIGSLRRGALVNLAATEVVLILSAIAGPNGSVVFECSTTGTRSAGDTITGVAAILVGGISVAVVGAPITSGMINSTLTAGNAGLSEALSTSPFAVQLGSSGILPTQDDYIHLLLNIGNPLLIQQIVVYFNVGVSFDITDAYAYTISSAALLTSSAFNLTEIVFPISALRKSGAVAGSTSAGDIRTLANCNGISLQILCSGTVAFQFGSFWISGGGNPDIGDTGAPMQYRIIPRSTVTGAEGNPSPVMRYGVSPRRQNVSIPLPAVAAALPAADSQVDIWDVYRAGRAVTSYRYIGSGAPSTTFVDQYFDNSSGRELPVQNYEPWPSVDVPFQVNSGGGTTITIYGTQIVISGPSSWPSTILRWLPGTLVQIGGQNAYTLRKRPTALSGTSYLFDIVECAGSLTPSLFTINEPNVARQMVPYMWGPDANGYFFAVGDKLRPGVIYFPTPNQPDITASTNTNEPSTPSEPLLNGAILDGLSFVASSDRWWTMRPTFVGNTVFTPFQQNVGRGLAAPCGICSDKVNIYFWAKDGICATGGAGFQSLTDGDLFLLFPHEDVQGANITRNGVTYYAPDYSRGATFRLAHINGFLFADYQDSGGTPRTLVGMIRRGEAGLTVAWSQDSYANSMSCRCALAQPEGTLTGTPLENYGLAVMGDNAGNVYQSRNLTGDNGAGIPVVVASFEYNADDLRGTQYWGDEYLDCLAVSEVTATPVSGGTTVAPATTIDASATRQFVPVSTSTGAGSGTYQNFLGLLISWTDFASAQTAPTTLYAWQPFLYDQVDTIADRPDDWSNCGTIGNKWIQGFILDADTFDAEKLIAIQDDASLALHTPQPSPVVHNGRQTIPYSFAQPFLAHMVKMVPQDKVQWRKFGIQYIFEPTPESVETWKTQNTAHGMKGYQHIGRIEASYAATADVSLAIVSFDGTSPAIITLPATAGATERLMLTPTFNKGTLYGYSATSTEPFQIFLNDWIVYVRAWGSAGPYTQYRLLGGVFGDGAKI